MSYRLKIDRRSMKAAKFIAKLQAEIQRALIDSGMTQQEVAERLGVDRSVINRRLKSKANLTARSVSDFAYALDQDVVIEFTKTSHSRKVNYAVGTSSSDEKPLKEKLDSAMISPSTKSGRARMFGEFERLEV
jgi:transcriptional regulator with XRE-family HTH domain